MLTYSFNDSKSDSLYEHLYQCIKQDIVSGTLVGNTKLPSKRSFAKHLGISVITIENAYSQLMAEGYIYSIPKKGFYVSELIDLQTEYSLVKPICTPKRKEVFKEVPKESSNKKNYSANFRSNHTTSDKFPFSIWAKITREVLSEEKDALLTPSASSGTMELRTAIAKHLEQFRGMNVKPEQIIIGAGTEYLYGMLIQLLGRNFIFGLEDPGYSKIAQVYESNQVCCRYIPVTPKGILVSELEKNDVTIMHLSPSHHFPTGVVTPIDRRYELLAWASKSPDRYIIEDDYDCEFRMLGKPIPPMYSIDLNESVIYMNTFTKTLTPTIRISYMILPSHLLEMYHQKLGFYACAVSNFEQQILARFIQKGYFEKHINRMRIYYREQRDAIIKAIKKSKLSEIVEIQEADAGLHFLLKINTTLADSKLVQKAAENGLGISSVSEYYHNPKESMHLFVINYSGISSDKIELAIHLLEKTILE